MHRACVGPGHLDGRVEGRFQGQVGQRCDDLVRRDGLEERRRDPHHPVHRGRVDERADELEELGGAENRVGNAGALDQPFLSNLGAKVPVAGEAVDPDDGERQMVPDSADLLRCEKVPARGLEEVRTARSSQEGEFDTSTTTWVPARARLSPSPVMMFTPEARDAATTS